MPTSQLTEAEIKKKCLTFIDDAQRHTIARDQRDRAEMYQDFFRGGTHQWTQEEYDIYKSRGVQPITINRCKPVCKALLGMYLQAEQDIRVRPRQSGSNNVAQVHTEIIKHTSDVSYGDYVFAQVFLRGCIDTEAYLKLEIDPAENVNGQPRFKGRSLWDVEIDRNATEYDLNESAAYVIDCEWRDKDEIAALYPEKEEEVRRGMLAEDAFDNRIVDRLANWMTDEGQGGLTAEDETEQIPDIELLRRYRYKVRSVFWKEIVPAMVVGDRQTGQMQVVTEEKLVWKLRRKGKKSVRFAITPWPMKLLHETVMLGGQMLEDKPEPLGPGVSDYPIVRYSPMWDLGYAVGALDDVTSLNREENIHRTQTIRILNQTANSGWIVGSDSNREGTKLLADFGSVPGVVVPLNKLGGKADKIQPNALPQGHFVLGEQFEQDIKRVSGVDDASQGYTTSQTESGRAINLKMQNNRLSNECFFKNLYRTLEIFGNLLLKVNLANDFYTNEEIKGIVGDSSMLNSKLLAQAKGRLTAKLLGVDLPQPMPPPPVDPAMMGLIRPEDQASVADTIRRGMQGADRYAKAYPQLATSWEDVIREEAKDMLLAELRADKGRYGVKVTVSPSAPTERLAQFFQVDALLTKYGQLIPPDLFIDLTDLPNKDELKARLMQAQQAQAMPIAKPAAMRAA